MLLRAATGFALIDRHLFLTPPWSNAHLSSGAPGRDLFPGTTHYTIVLGERGASRVADLIDEFSQRITKRS